MDVFLKMKFNHKAHKVFAKGAAIWDLMRLF